MPTKKKLAAPVNLDEFAIRILPPDRRLGTKLALKASVICRANGLMKVILHPETRVMHCVLDHISAIERMNVALKPLGLQLVKSTKVAAAYEWEQHQVKV